MIISIKPYQWGGNKSDGFSRLAARVRILFSYRLPAAVRRNPHGGRLTNPMTWLMGAHAQVYRLPSACAHLGLYGSAQGVFCAPSLTISNNQYAIKST